MSCATGRGGSYNSLSYGTTRDTQDSHPGSCVKVQYSFAIEVHQKMMLSCLSTTLSSPLVIPPPPPFPSRSAEFGLGESTRGRAHGPLLPLRRPRRASEGGGGSRVGCWYQMGGRSRRRPMVVRNIIRSLSLQMGGEGKQREEGVGGLRCDGSV